MCSQTLVLSYAYHCCEFMPLMEGGAGGQGEGGAGGQGEGGAADEEDEAPTDFVIVPGPRADLAAWANATDIWSHRAYAVPRPLAAACRVT